MSVFHTEVVVKEDGTITIDGLPFRAGEKVGVDVRTRETIDINEARYPLRGEFFRYDGPFESVAESDWESLK